jgi:hypothetical protein
MKRAPLEHQDEEYLILPDCQEVLRNKGSTEGEQEGANQSCQLKCTQEACTKTAPGRFERIAEGERVVYKS